MSEPLKVGDVCIGQNFVNDTECNGLECLIIGALEERQFLTHDGEEGMELLFKVEWQDGSVSLQAPYTLRKKRPPTSAKFLMREAINKAKQPHLVPA